MPLLANGPKPRVILGLMTFGEDEAAGARITSMDETNKALDHLQAGGYNEIDTARVYVGGKQEAWTRKANWKERGLTLAVGRHSPLIIMKMALQKTREGDANPGVTDESVSNTSGYPQGRCYYCTVRDKLKRIGNRLR